MTQSLRSARTLSTLVLAALVLLPLAACGGDEPPVPPQVAEPGPAGPAGPANTGPADAGAPDAGVQPIRGGDGAPPSIRWDLPPGWEEQPPSSTMRMAQARIPGEAGDAEMTVFFFGPGGGGGTEANIERWIGQMDVAEGTEAQREEFEVNGYDVTQVEVEGTLKASGMGMGPTTDQPDYRMLAAVVEGPGGPWFFKITGPDQTVSDARDGFRQLLETLGPA